MKKKKKLPFMTSYVIDAVRTAIMAEFVKPALNFGVEAVKSKTLYMVDLSDSRSFMNNTLAKIFKNFPCRANMSMSETGYSSNEKSIVEPQSWDFKNNYIDMTIYGGVPIFIHTSNKTVRNDAEQIFRTPALALITLNHPYCRRVMNDFLEKVKRMTIAYETKHGSQIYLLHQYLNQADILDMRLRTFNDVFIPHEHRELLETSIDSYMSKRQWYIDNNIPNHFGILLYSRPGTGKSSIVQAIASHVNGPLYVASGDSIGSINDIILSQIGRHAFGDHQYRVLVFEDVDSGLFNLTRIDDDNNHEKNKKKVGLATILNALDGIGSPTNIIYVFTTNHIERLDPALIRPGRCDLKLEIPCVIHETLEQFIKFHYQIDIELDRSVPLKENMTFAELQTRVMCGNTVDQLLDYCKKGVDEHE